jgi:hypothetical protein
MAVDVSNVADLEYQNLIKTLETAGSVSPQHHDRLRQLVNNFISEHQTFPEEKLDELQGRVEILRQKISYHEDDSDDEDEAQKPSCCCLISTAFATASAAAYIIFRFH